MCVCVVADQNAATAQSSRAHTQPQKHKRAHRNAPPQPPRRFVCVSFVASRFPFPRLPSLHACVDVLRRFALFKRVIERKEKKEGERVSGGGRVALRITMGQHRAQAAHTTTLNHITQTHTHTPTNSKTKNRAHVHAAARACTAILHHRSTKRMEEKKKEIREKRERRRAHTKNARMRGGHIPPQQHPQQQGLRSGSELISAAFCATHQHPHQQQQQQEGKRSVHNVRSPHQDNKRSHNEKEKENNNGRRDTASGK